jgi:hypothetical protein
VGPRFVDHLISAVSQADYAVYGMCGGSSGNEGTSAYLVRQSSIANDEVPRLASVAARLQLLIADGSPSSSSALASELAAACKILEDLAINLRDGT